MPDLGRFLGGAAGGAEIGAIGGPVGAAVGGVAGAILSLFGKSDEQIEAQHKNELLKRIAEIRAQAIRTGLGQLSDVTTRQAANVRQAAAQRAASLGRTGEAESFIAPGEQATMAQGSAAARQYMTDINREYGGAELRAEQDYAGRPIQPNISDYLQTIGQSAMAYKQNQDLMKIWSDYVKGGGAGKVEAGIGPTDVTNPLTGGTAQPAPFNFINQMAEAYKPRYPRIPAYSEFQ